MGNAMDMLQRKLDGALANGLTWARVELHSSHAPVEDVAAVAEELHWHVKSVWTDDKATTHVLLRYEAP